MDKDKTGTIVILISVVIGFITHWLWRHDLISILGGIFCAMVAMNLMPELFYVGDKKGEYSILMVLQGMQLCTLLLIAKMEIIPVFWLVVFGLGVLRIHLLSGTEELAARP